MFDEMKNDYLTHTLVFFARVELKKKKKKHAREGKLTHLFLENEIYSIWAHGILRRTVLFEG